MRVKEVFVLKEAVDDLKKGRSFYSSKDKIIGDYFWNSLVSDIKSLSVYGGIHKIEYGFHRMLSKRFPYAIYYFVKNENVYVVAVLPLKRSEDWRRSVLKNR